MKKELLNALYNGTVNFEYKKKDGSTRQAKGTLCQNIIPDEHKNNKELRFDVPAIDTLLKIKNIGTIEEYAESNDIKFIKKENNEYVFVFKKKNKEDIITYYDLDVNDYRSFKEENFIQIIKE